MNSSVAPPPPDTQGLLGTRDLGGFGYGIGVSIGILLLITTITLASYYCTRAGTAGSSRANRTSPEAAAGGDPLDPRQGFVVVDMGLDESTIKSYPKLTYSEARESYNKKTDSTASCCSICLADYKSSDQLRVLPDCHHLFHVKCVDPWLRLHPTCPVCRTSPLPTPVATPLAEVTPLAARRDIESS